MENKMICAKMAKQIATEQIKENSILESKIANDLVAGSVAELIVKTAKEGYLCCDYELPKERLNANFKDIYSVIKNITNILRKKYGYAVSDIGGCRIHISWNRAKE